MLNGHVILALCILAGFLSFIMSFWSFCKGARNRLPDVSRIEIGAGGYLLSTNLNPVGVRARNAGLRWFQAFFMFFGLGGMSNWWACVLAGRMKFPDSTTVGFGLVALACIAVIAAAQRK